MKYRLTFCILLLLFVAGSMSLIMAQTPQWITASESQSETNTWLGFKKDFVVSSVPQVLKACIAVDSNTGYGLMINLLFLKEVLNEVQIEMIPILIVLILRLI